MSLADAPRVIDGRARWLGNKGYMVDTLHVNSRSSSNHNAVQIAEYLVAEQPTQNQDIVLIEHSKGVADMLRTLVDFSSVTDRVVAVVSMAGTANGSPLANWVTAGHAGWEALISSERCAPGDHWAAAIPMEEAKPFFAGHQGTDGPYPRDLLFEAMALFLAEALNAQSAQ